MNKEQALQQLEEQVLVPILTDHVIELEQYFRRNEKQLVEQFISSFRQICNRAAHIQQQDEKWNIGFVHYSMLRTSILEGTFHYFVEAYSEQWYWDTHECYERYDVSWAFQQLPALRNTLGERSKMYMTLLSPADVDYLLLKHIDCFTQFVTAIARKAMPIIIQLDEFQALQQAECVRIRVGEYKDYSEDVLVIDRSEKDVEAITSRLMQKKDTCAYEAFTDMDLSELIVEEMDLRYTDFSNSNLQASRFHSCALIGTKWMKASLGQADFTSSILTDADFRDSDLTGAIFTLTTDEGWRDVMHRALGLLGVNFSNANLTKADFSQAQLYGANFEGANMQDAVFALSDRQRYKLTEQQIQAIQWIG